MAEESTKSWADTDSDSSSSSSSSSDSEQEEVHCLMADQTSDDEVFDFSNIEFTREDLVSALNDMVKEYRKLSHTFEEVKAENDDLKNSSAEPSAVELGEADSLTIELRQEVIKDRKVLMAEERTKSWADTDSDSSSSSSSSSDSEQEEVHYLMADQTSDDEVFDFSNIEFTLEDLVSALNDMVKEYRKLSKTFEEVKDENDDLKNSSVEPSTVELGEADSLKIELNKLIAENELLRNESSELKAEIEKLNLTMSSWTKSSASLDKLSGIQKPASDRTELCFNSSESSEGETSTQSQLVYDKFNKMRFVKASVTSDSCESIKYNDQTSPKLNHKGKSGIGYQRPENSKPSWLKNKLDKDKAKAGSKSFVPNQPRRNSTKVKSGWRKVQPRRDLNGQNMKSTLNRSHHGFAQTLTDSSTGKTVKRYIKISSDVLTIAAPAVTISILAYSKLIYQSAMASSLFVNTVHVCFESVLSMDNAGMVVMFESLVATGLKGFLGCPVVIHEAALLEFFENGSVRDGLVVSTVNGVTVEISEQLFAEMFELPVEGLTDFSEIPKDLVFDARSIVSLSGEPVSISGKNKEMTIEFRLLCDILAKTISVKAGSFDAITQEKFLMMAAITCGVRINWNRLLFNILKDMVTPGTRQAKGYSIQISLLLENVPKLELGESSEFPSSKILTEKRVHRPAVTTVAEPFVKKKRTTKSKSGSSKDKLEILSVAHEAVPLQIIAPTPVSKKRTTKSKSGSSKDKLEILSVAHEAVPLQIIAPTPVSQTEQPSVPKRKTQKRNRKLILGSDDEFVEQPAAKVAGETVVEQEPVVEVPGETVIEGIAEPHSEPAVADFANVGMSTADDFDTIIEQVLAETAQIGPDEEEQDVGGLDVGEQAAPKADEFEQWLNLSYEELHARQAGQPVVTSSDTDEDMDTVEEMETEAVEQSAYETMSLEDILMTIPVECPLPSANVEIMKITLGKSISIPGVDEGDWYKADLPTIPVMDKGKAPLMERDPIKGNPVKEQFSLILADIEVLVLLREQIIDEARKINFIPGEGSSATDLKVLEMLSDLHMFVAEDLKEQTIAHGLKWEKTCCSKIFEGRPRDRGAIISRTNTNSRSTCWIRTMICVDGVWVIEPCGDHWVTIPREVVNNENSRQRSYDNTLPPVSAFFKVMKKRWGDVCIEAIDFSVSGKLLPVGSINFCRTLAVVEPVSNFGSRRQTVISLGWSQLCTAFVQYSLFSGLNTDDIRSFVSTIALDMSMLRDVQLEGFTRRFDACRPSRNTRSPSLAPGELLATPNTKCRRSC
ncbi:hypothetical protein F511_17242 [Dorcoceras hygrometricum]|uniref:Dystroglycan-like n=1 Tax=Dorcoceras hygrometricum TaxID=472368 RepID=A0A2Z7ARH7_9LAMI|nr:hypothetical protein F511_17242 [Dorcoceras hygrometricum]